MTNIPETKMILKRKRLQSNDDDDDSEEYKRPHKQIKRFSKDSGIDLDLLICSQDNLEYEPEENDFMYLQKRGRCNEKGGNEEQHEHVTLQLSKNEVFRRRRRPPGWTSSILISNGGECALDITKRFENENAFQDDSISVKDLLRKNFKYLKDELDPDEITDYLCRDEVITEEVVERIRESRSRRRKVDILIKHLVHREDSSDLDMSGIKTSFYNALVETGNKAVIEKLTGTRNCPQKEIDGNPTAYKKFLVKYLVKIAENIDPLDFMDDALVRDALSFPDHEDILNIPFRRSRTRAYLSAIATCPVSAVGHLLDPMIHAYSYLKNPFLGKYKSLRSPFNSDDFEDVQTFLSSQLDCQVESGELTFQVTSRQTSSNDLVRPGSDLKLRFRIRFTEQKDFYEKILQRQTVSEIERRAVDNFSSQSLQNFEKFLNGCIVRFQELSFSSIVIHVKTECVESLQKIRKACDDGTALEMLLSLLSDDDRERLKDMKATNIKLDVIGNKHDCLLTTSETDLQIRSISLLDIRQHEEYLLDELDGKSFADALSKRSGISSEFCLEISKQQRRKDRTRLLLETLITDADASWFCDQLKTKKRYVLDYLLAHRTTRSSDGPSEDERQIVLSYTFDIAPDNESKKKEPEEISQSSFNHMELNSESGIFSGSSVSSTKTEEDQSNKTEITQKWVHEHFLEKMPDTMSPASANDGVDAVLLHRRVMEVNSSSRDFIYKDHLDRFGLAPPRRLMLETPYHHTHSVTRGDTAKGEGTELHSRVEESVSAEKKDATINQTSSFDGSFEEDTESVHLIPVQRRRSPFAFNHQMKVHSNYFRLPLGLAPPRLMLETPYHHTHSVTRGDTAKGVGTELHPRVEESVSAEKKDACSFEEYTESVLLRPVKRPRSPLAFNHYFKHPLSARKQQSKAEKQKSIGEAKKPYSRSSMQFF